MQDINYPVGFTIFKLEEDREEYRERYAQEQAEEDARIQAQVDAKQSALNKLMALGLTEEEALALGVK